MSDEYHHVRTLVSFIMYDSDHGPLLLKRSSFRSGIRPWLRSFVSLLASAPACPWRRSGPMFSSGAAGITIPTVLAR